MALRVAPAWAIPLYSHEGITNPVDEGWIRGGPEDIPGVEDGPVTDELPAWCINDFGSALGDALNYTVILTPAENELLVTNGWVMRMRVKVVNEDDPLDAGVSLGYFDGVTLWELHLGRSGTDLLLGMRQDGGGLSDETISGLGEYYHLFELFYDSGAGTASLFVDGNGVTALADFAGKKDSDYLADPDTNYFWWGAGGSSQTGHGHYNLVSIAVPEASTAVLLAFGLTGLAINRRRCGA